MVGINGERRVIKELCLILFSMHTHRMYATKHNSTSLPNGRMDARAKEFNIEKKRDPDEAFYAFFHFTIMHIPSGVHSALQTHRRISIFKLYNFKPKRKCNEIIAVVRCHRMCSECVYFFVCNFAVHCHRTLNCTSFLLAHRPSSVDSSVHGQ